MTPPAFVCHDTRVIVDADAAACELFRCDRDWLIDRQITDLIDGDEDAGLKPLAKLRMQLLRERGELPVWEAPFVRADLTKFWAEIHSYFDGRTYCTKLTYRHEW